MKYLRDIFYRLAAMKSLTVAQDKTKGASCFQSGASAMASLGSADSALNLIGAMMLNLYSGKVHAGIYVGETAPGTSYANAPIGSFFFQYTISSGAISDLVVWLKASSTVWSPIINAGTADDIGTAATGVTASEMVSGRDHTTILTLSTALPAIAGGANLAVGKLLYTMPAGEILIKSTYMSVALTAANGNIDADTPDVGIGTVIGSGAVAVLGGTATFEDLLTGQTASNCTGTATVAAVATAKHMLTAGAHTVHLNVADGWAASGETACPVTGTVTINWQRMDA
jgi:hypothetical protein